MKTIATLIFLLFTLSLISFGQERDSINKYVVYEFADTGAEPIGGPEIMQRWILDHFNRDLIISADTIDCSSSRNGRVFVQFIIDEQGRLIEPQIVYGIGEPYDSEALRLMSEMPIKWIPGTKDGVNIRIRTGKAIYFCTLE